MPMFQYRKRYGPVATTLDPDKEGMDVFQYRKRYGPVATLQRINERSIMRFQYRKRYGPVATPRRLLPGMMGRVSIPQAVWASCNSVPAEPRGYRPEIGHLENLDGRMRLWGFAGGFCPMWLLYAFFTAFASLCTHFFAVFCPI